MILDIALAFRTAFYLRLFLLSTLNVCFMKIRSKHSSNTLRLWCMLRKNFWSGSLAYKSTLEKQYFIVYEPKEEVISSKIDRMAAI